MGSEASETDGKLSRRTILGMAGAVGGSLALGASGAANALTGRLLKAEQSPLICLTAAGGPPPLTGPARKVRFAYNATGICTASVPVALHLGYFKKHNLDVEFVKLAGSTDQMLEALATRKAEVGVSMLLTWLKPLESGFDVKLTSAVHGGCTRLLVKRSSGIDKLEKLKGKTIGVSKLGASPRNFFAVLLNKHGIDPDSGVNWREFPGDLLGTVLERGEVDAIADNDPLIWMTRHRSNDEFIELASNLSENYFNLSCCALGFGGEYVREKLDEVAALTRAIREAAAHVYLKPDEAAEVFSQYTPKVPVAYLAAMLRSHTHNHRPQGDDLRKEVVEIVADLKQARVIKPSTDPEKFARKIVLESLA